MTGVLIDKVEVVDCGDLAGPGDDAYIVAVHGGGLTGWYGPLAAAPATLMRRSLAPVVVEVAVEDRLGLQASIQRLLRTQAGVFMSWAIGALDCAVWDL